MRIRVTDPSGLGVKSAVELVSEANQFQKTLTTDGAGDLVVKRIPFGVYRVQIDHPGFAEFRDSIEVRSAVALDYTAKLSIAAANTSVLVNDADTLIDPHRTGDINRIGSDMIQERVSSLPGRSLQELVNSQPGWLYEGNAVLHPRGSEYQTQFVVDGIPLTDNRSPGFAPEIESDDVESLTIYTAGIPRRSLAEKWAAWWKWIHSRIRPADFMAKWFSLGGSFDTLGSYARGQYQWGKNTLGFSADGNLTSYYLNLPPVTQNYTNNGHDRGFRGCGTNGI